MTSKPYIDPKQVDKPSRKAVRKQAKIDREENINSMTTPQILWYLVQRERLWLIATYATAVTIALIIFI